MRVLNIVLVLASAIGALARGIQPDQSSLRAPSSSLTGRSAHHERMTNAMRLRRGLPPLRPRVIPRQPLAGTPTTSDGLHLAARASPSPSPSSQPSGVPPPPSFEGVVKLTSKLDGSFVGFISKSFQIFGEFGVVTSLDDALSVSIAGLRSGLNGPVDVRGSNGAQSPVDFLGAVNGFASDSDVLAPGSSNYKYLAGVGSTPAWSSPASSNANAFTQATGIEEASESAIWFVNTFSKELSAQWINPDGKPALHTEVLFYPSDNVLVLTGDVAAFTADFGDAVPVTLSLFALSS
ncbi:hypothetical protein EXIGLDRAFT_306152 [Exidia glandulosa HHB12029]|uniref:Uncharacterized protein n=1 Tax=Exidia glandulosa HHB12029 TaxID=1314781 RepID=A0A165D415_EXIGL|nr:hypothetical protein EXIGLDRAFT_306152 [Exidia glandulosa HHB12029]